MSSDRSTTRARALVLVVAGLGGPVGALVAASKLEMSTPRVIIATLGYEVLVGAVAFMLFLFGDVKARWTPRITARIDSFLLRVTSPTWRRYKSSVIASTDYIETKGLATKGQFTLSMTDIFIDLGVIPSEPSNSTHSVIGYATANQGALKQPGVRTIGAWVTNACSNKEALVIIGPPGSGKTTLIRNLANSVARRRLPSELRSVRGRLPIILEVRNLGDIESVVDGDLAQLVHNRISKASPTTNTAIEWVDLRLRRGQFLLLFDGLDELGSEAERRKLVDWLDQQMEIYNRATFIVTSRPFGYIRHQLSKALVVQTQPLTLDQIQAFIRAWYKSTTTRSYGKYKDSAKLAAEMGFDQLFSALSASEPLMELAMNPLLLTMICHVHNFRGALPGSRLELYAEICDVFLARRHQARGVSVSMSAGQKIVILQKLAFAMMDGAIREIKVDAAAGHILSELSLVSPGTSPVAFLRDVERSSGILLERERDVYAFAHPTFQEYLAALEIKESSQQGALLARIFEPWWHETIRLYSAMADASTIVTACLDQAERSDELVALAVACIAEARQVSLEARKRMADLLDPTDVRDSGQLVAAARARLATRANSEVPLGRMRWGSSSPITWLEYEYFRRSTSHAQGPDHWIEYPGNDEILHGSAIGIRKKDAEQFCEWLRSRDASGRIYELPSPDESRILRDDANNTHSKEAILSSYSDIGAEDYTTRFWPFATYLQRISRPSTYPDASSTRLEDMAEPFDADLQEFSSRVATLGEQLGLNDRFNSSVGVISEMIKIQWRSTRTVDIGQTLIDQGQCITLAASNLGVDESEQLRTLHQLINASLARAQNQTQNSWGLVTSPGQRLRDEDRLTHQESRASILEALGISLVMLSIRTGQGVNLLSLSKERMRRGRTPNSTKLLYSLVRALAGIYCDLLLAEGRLIGKAAPSGHLRYVASRILSGEVVDRSHQELSLYVRHVKPILEGLIALVVLILIMPLLLAISIVILLSDGGPVLYRQSRVGRYGRWFYMYKFRTLRHDAGEGPLPSMVEGTGSLFKITYDPRITPFGRFLRALSLDELPNLFNVLKGDMALVGPRPMLPREYAAMPKWLKQTGLKPGMTGLWQVESDHERDEMSATMTYAENAGILLDLKIVFTTTSRVLAKRGSF
jgi:lipopolysaccharide/colanic/teichoic acid biosynthesis glycosyltransferase